MIGPEPFIHWDGEGRTERPKWLVKEFFAERSVSLLIGESQAGKSFVAIDLAGSMALGQDFFGRRTKAGGAFYAAAEAVSTIADRVHAFKLGRLGSVANLVRQAGAVFEVPNLAVSWAECPNLAIEQNVALLISWIKEANLRCLERHEMPIRLVVVDTLVAAFGIEDWNSASQCQRAMAALKRIAAECDVAVVGVHHLGKDLTRGASGSFALTAGADAIVSVIRSMEDALSGEVQSRNIALTKSRYCVTGAQVSFELVSIEVDHDEEGDPVESAYIELKQMTTRVVVKSRRSRSKTESLGVTVFRRAFLLSLPEADDSSMVESAKVAPLEIVRKHFYAIYHGKNDDPEGCTTARRQAFNRARKEVAKLKEFGLEIQDGVDVVRLSVPSSNSLHGGANGH